MSKMKMYAYLTMMMAMAGGSGYPFAMKDEKEYQSMTDAERLSYEQEIKRRYRNVMIKKGLKEFHFQNHSISIFALNEKNAKRKYENLKKDL